MEAKKWYTSKTEITNIIFGIGILVQVITGETWLDAETQAAIIVIINIILRLVTKQPLAK